MKQSRQTLLYYTNKHETNIIVQKCMVQEGEPSGQGSRHRLADSGRSPSEGAAITAPGRQLSAHTWAAPVYCVRACAREQNKQSQGTADQRNHCRNHMQGTADQRNHIQVDGTGSRVRLAATHPPCGWVSAITLRTGEGGHICSIAPHMCDGVSITPHTCVYV